MQLPLALNHVGVTVPDVFSAVDWYCDVFGMTVLMPPRELTAGAHGEAAQVLGSGFRRAWQAHLLTANGAGVEVFQFIDPRPRPADDTVPFTRRGAWHVCLTHPDPHSVLQYARESGGTVLCEPTQFVPGRPWTLSYLNDPWGVTWEIMSACYAEIFSNWPLRDQEPLPVFVPRPVPTAVQ